MSRIKEKADRFLAKITPAFDKWGPIENELGVGRPRIELKAGAWGDWCQIVLSSDTEQSYKELRLVTTDGEMIVSPGVDAVFGQVNLDCKAGERIILSGKCDPVNAVRLGEMLVNARPLSGWQVGQHSIPILSR